MENREWEESIKEVNAHLLFTIFHFPFFQRKKYD